MDRHQSEENVLAADALALEQMNVAFAAIRGDDEQREAFLLELRAWESADADPDVPVPAFGDRVANAV